MFESEGEVMMIQTILSALQSNEELHAWNLRVINKKSYQLYFVKQNLDMNTLDMLDY
jgi:hypothetical protein